MEYKTKTLCKDNYYLNFMETTCPNGKKWAYAKRVNTNGVVIIVPYIKTDEGEFTVFLKTCRPPLIAEGISEFNLEFPAGLVGDENKAETFQDALKKELLEETGLKAEKFIIKNDKLSSSAGCISEVSTVAIAIISNIKQHQKPIDDDGIIQDRLFVKISDIKNFVKDCQNNGWCIGAQTLAGVFYLFEEIDIF